MSQANSVLKVRETPRDLTAFQRNILIILSDESQYGLAIKRELEEYYNAEVNHGRLYPNLDNLVAMGLVAKTALDKRTNQYELTDEGYDAVVANIEWTLSKVLSDDTRVDAIEELVAKHSE